MRLFRFSRSKKPEPAFPNVDFALGVPEGPGLQEGALKPGGSIAFIVPGMTGGSGGLTSILRLGTWLSRFGYKVVYVSYLPQSRHDLEAIARRNLPDWRGVFMEWDTFRSGGGRFDVGVATLWVSCYHLMKYLDRFGRKAYFIQDYEPYFYPVGDHYCLAENTYRLGLHHISLGAWNLQRIAFHTGIGDGTEVVFPVELEQYPLVRRSLRREGEVRLAVYLKREDKRAGSLLSLGLKIAEDRFRNQGVPMDIRVFGLDSSRPWSLPAGQNLGQLSMSQLQELYAWADFGLVASLTNISLINYEMLACGLPVIDLAAGSASVFFDETEMIFARTAPEGVYESLATWRGRKADLEAMVARSQDKIHRNNWTWEQTARQFESALRSPPT